MIDFGDKVCKLRESKGMTQTSFAELLGVSRGKISQIELNNSRPTIDFILVVINTFSISADYFFYENIDLKEINDTNISTKTNLVTEPTPKYEAKNDNHLLIIIESLKDQIKTKDMLIHNQEELISLLKSK